MTQNIERANTRLNNIQAIEPLLGALRTMSMGAWLMALKKLADMTSYEATYNNILNEILPHIKQIRRREQKHTDLSPEIADTIVLIIGSERGLCGKFNKVLAENAIAWIETQNFSSYQIWAMGARMIRELVRMHVNLTWRNPLPANKLSTYQQSYRTTQTWLDQYEAYAFNNFVILFNEIEKKGKYQFSIFNLLPYEIQHAKFVAEEVEQRWPPPIIETDPSGIYHQIIQHFIASSFYQILLKSSAAEHSSRYKLMQEAKDNAEDIIEELILVINAERKRQITQEMQELAAGAGLLDNM